MIKVYHYNSLTKSEVDRLNGADGGWDSESRFSRYADITSGFKGIDSVVEAWNLDEYTYVANVDTNDRDEAYYLTNHTEYDWTLNYQASVIGTGERQRSTSIGDILENNGTYYVVASVGFKEVEVAA